MMPDIAPARRVRGAASTDKVRFAKELRQAATPTEGLLWERLRGKALGAKFRRQHPVGDFVLDFYCEEARLGVEIDGSVHDGREQHDEWWDGRLQRLVSPLCRRRAPPLPRALEERTQGEGAGG